MSAASAATTRETVGSEATCPNRSGWARTTARSEAQSPPSATAVARSTRTLPGSWTARAGRHGANADDRPRLRPAIRIDSRINNAPDDEISDSRTGSRTRLGTGLRFTYGVPSTWMTNDFSNRQSSKQDRHFRALHAERNTSQMKSRG